MPEDICPLLVDAVMKQFETGGIRMKLVAARVFIAMDKINLDFEVKR